MTPTDRSALAVVGRRVAIGLLALAPVLGLALWPRHGDDPGPVASVIGADARTAVAPTTGFPSRAIGLLEFTQDGQPATCTAFLVDRNSAATAGHCLHGGAGGAFSTGVTFTPGRDGATAPYGTCAATNIRVAGPWTTSSDERHDYGVVQLDCNVGDTTGWFGLFDAVRNAQLSGVTTHLRGYQDDKPVGTMWTSKDRMRSVGRHLLFYDNDVRGDAGHGAPVYRWVTACGGPCALGIHVSDGHGTGTHALHNHGVRLNEGKWRLIRQWASFNG